MKFDLIFRRLPMVIGSLHSQSLFSVGVNYLFDICILFGLQGIVTVKMTISTDFDILMISAKQRLYPMYSIFVFRRRVSLKDPGRSKELGFPPNNCVIWMISISLTMDWPHGLIPGHNTVLRRSVNRVYFMSVSYSM